MGHHSSGTKPSTPAAVVHYDPSIELPSTARSPLPPFATLPPPVRPRRRQPVLPITASLARYLARLPPQRTPPSCRLPAIPHVSKVGVGVSRPQRTTAMPTSSVIQDAAAATVTTPIRVAYK
ncbi:hypothetical protein ACLOJK_025946 [Asimina triloba]